MTVHERPLGLAGRLARSFIGSKLTLLLALAALLAGVVATINLPREEEPQINVPMFDVLVPFPGASAREVEQRITNVGERRLWEIPGVEYIYSTSQANLALFIVRFKVGTNPDDAMTRIYTKTFANVDSLPPGCGQPLIKPRSIDDVPILALTLSGNHLDGFALRRAAAALRQEISAVDNVSETDIIGGQRRQFLVHFHPKKLNRYRISPLEVVALLQASNRRLPAGHISSGDEQILVETDALIRSADELKTVVIGISAGNPVRLRDVADVEDGPDEDEREVWTQSGAAEVGANGSPEPAVTIAVSKRRGANATTVVRDVLARIDSVRHQDFPDGIQLSITRNYGATAKEKSDELLFHVLLATLSVTLLIALTLGLREALVVLIAIPVTLALTLVIYFLFGYTLNRITLFALIFSIGILVDDAIVVVENIHRHFTMKDGRPLRELAVHAVAEVGNPTILATWAVIAAILPMAFVGGLMGPYMRPIPVGASFAMIFSLLIAFMITPWAFVHVLEWWKPRESSHGAEGRLDHFYRRGMRTLLENSAARWLYLGAMMFLLLGAVSLLYFKAVTVKMLPFDNKDEFEVVLNMPESSSFSATRRAAAEVADTLRQIPEARRVTTYVGTAAPYNFNGLVRHYFFRQQPNQADILVNLKGRHERKRSSHAIAKDARGPVHTIAAKYGARVQVAEVPPGPPVLSTLVFEIYGPSAEKRLDLSKALRRLLEETDGIVDVDTYVPDPQPLERLLVDREMATLNGVAPAQIVQTVGMALDGQTVDLAHTDHDLEPVEIRWRLAASERKASSVESITLLSRNGTPIPLQAVLHPERTLQDQPIYHKNLLPVTYVIADVAGKQESPVYAVLDLGKKIDALARENGVTLTQYYAHQPRSSAETALKWDGEWHITVEVFRDLGIAFALVLILIYILVVAWFESFLIPLVIMAPIPLTLVGILPGHWLFHAYFTATSMIGFIAGAGIVVRNSIILVDFIQLRLDEGLPLKEAVIDAGAVRFRPMLLTAAAVAVGAGVILFDPIFQGLAVALMAGEVASTVLSRVAVPVLYYMLTRHFKIHRKETPT